MLVEEVVSSSGDVLAPDLDHADPPYFHVIARHAEGDS